METDHTVANLQYVVSQLLVEHDRKTIWDALGVNPATFGRWIKGSRPQSDSVRRLAHFASINFNDFSLLSPSAFKQKYKRISWQIRDRQQNEPAEQRRVDFRCISKSEKSIQLVYARHRGSYFMYTKQMDDPRTRRMNVHLLTIDGFSERGTGFTIYRRFDESIWNEYRGLVFDVDGFLHFFGEDADRHDMIMMITGRLDEREAGQLVEGRMVSSKRSGMTPHPSVWKVALVYIVAGIIKPESVREYLHARNDISEFAVNVRSVIGPIFRG